jgi:hypothetical protein
MLLEMRLESIHLQWPQHTSCSWGDHSHYCSSARWRGCQWGKPKWHMYFPAVEWYRLSHTCMYCLCVCVCMCFTASVNGVGGASGVFGAASASNHYRNEAVWWETLQEFSCHRIAPAEHTYFLDDQLSTSREGGQMGTTGIQWGVSGNCPATKLHCYNSMNKRSSCETCEVNNC